MRGRDAHGNVTNLIFCEPDTGKLLRKLAETRAHLTTCQFNPDGRTIVATDDKTKGELKTILLSLRSGLPRPVRLAERI